MMDAELSGADTQRENGSPEAEDLAQGGRSKEATNSNTEASVDMDFAVQDVICFAKMFPMCLRVRPVCVNVLLSLRAICFPCIVRSGCSKACHSGERFVFRMAYFSSFGIGLQICVVYVFSMGCHECFHFMPRQSKRKCFARSRRLGPRGQD